MPAPIAPWMLVNEALTIWIFRIAIKAPRLAPITATQTFAGTVEAVTGLLVASMIASPRLVGLVLALGVDRRLDRHARPQQAGELAVVEHDLHRDALHDLGEVAGRIVGRQQREFEAAGR